MQFCSWELMDQEKLTFSFDGTVNKDDSDNEIVRMALKQVEKTLKQLGARSRSSQAYTVGYELGYIKGVLEHVLRIIPESQNKEAYMKGYVSGYIQGMLYSFKRGDFERENCNKKIEEL